MTTFILTLLLLIAGVFAGLIQYFVDFLGLQIYDSEETTSTALIEEQTPDFWTRLKNFLKRNWQLFGYLIIGIAGALLMPLIARLANLPGVKHDFSCLGEPNCTSNGWDMFIILGYGIISGYSSVRLIRSFGSFLIGNFTKTLQSQQQALKEGKRQIAELIEAQQYSLIEAKKEITDLKERFLNGSKLISNTFTPYAESFTNVNQWTSNYFDEAKNEIDKKLYYVGVNLQDNVSIFNTINSLLTNTHKRQINYKPSHHLYPVVDRYPDGYLRSIYSGKSFDLETLIKLDSLVDTARDEALRNFSSFNLSSDDYKNRLEDLELSLPYNCEHVVPQSWFNKKEPMRGDLHHLFTCEMRCNSFRSNYKYFDFIDYNGAAFTNIIKDSCGKLENEVFEPERNKGIVARAVLYFLARYPSKIELGKGYSEEDIPTLVKWHKEEPVTLYELHRNQEVYKLQGNRNPFIDFPALVEKIDFSTSLKFKQSDGFGQSDSNFGDDMEATAEFNGDNAFSNCEGNPKPKPWKDWRPAKSLVALRKQINSMAPKRNTKSDGMVGDLAHQLNDSDHNPWVWDKVLNKGVVTAIDITHDPAGKCDCNVMAKSLATIKDPRIKYVIWNKKIINASSINGSEPWTWRPYNGKNPHDKHIHISVKCDIDNYDSESRWNIMVNNEAVLV